MSRTVSVQTDIVFEEEDAWDQLQEHKYEIEDLKISLQEARMSLHEAQIKIQETKLGASAATPKQNKPVPNRMVAGVGSAEPRQNDLRSLMTWLAGEVNLEAAPVWIQQAGTLEFGHGEQRIPAVLGRTQQWELNCSLRLSVPEQVVSQMTQMLRQLQTGEGLPQHSLSQLANDWEIVMGQSPTPEEPNPLYVLNAKEQLVIIVATWPKPYFDANTYFKSMPTPPRYNIRDRVEVFYQDQWYAGSIRLIHDNKYGVQCDVDAEGIITYATAESMRRTNTPDPRNRLGVSPRRHRRVKSAVI